MNFLNHNLPKLSKNDFLYINPNFPELPSSIFIDNLIFNDNLESINSDSNANFDSINDFSKRLEKNSEYIENNELSSIRFSYSGSSFNDNSFHNSKSIGALDINIPPKKEKIFKIEYSKYFTIFNSGIYDDYSQKIIYEALNETNKNRKKLQSKDTNIFIQSSKKHRKKKKNIQQRKQNADNIRKKIKARFLKSLRNEINKKLKKAGSKHIFSFLPQSFIINISKEKNKEILNLTFKEILNKNFCNGIKERKADMKKYEYNLFVLNYLENNKEISEKSNFNAIKNMKYSKIFSEYLKSKEFGQEISTLKQEKENDKYIKDYIIMARNLLSFFNL